MISFTRGEGYGLPLVDAAASGLPIVATNWSGHLQFLSKGHFSKGAPKIVLNFKRKYKIAQTHKS